MLEMNFLMHSRTISDKYLQQMFPVTGFILSYVFMTLQAFFAFLIFGLDQKMVIEPFMRR